MVLHTVNPCLIPGPSDGPLGTARYRHNIYPLIPTTTTVRKKFQLFMSRGNEGEVEHAVKSAWKGVENQRAPSRLLSLWPLL